MQEQLFIIGDVHGCYHTLIALLSYWNCNTQRLIFVGDLIDRGNFSSKVVLHVQSLMAQYNAIAVKGNHEYELIQFIQSGNNNWLTQCGHKTMLEFHRANYNPYTDIDWYRSLPLKYETEHILVTHAGLSQHPNPYSETNPKGVLWNRTSLQNIGKLQVYGHTPKSSIRYNEEAHAYCIDTGASHGKMLSAIILDHQGSFLKGYEIPTKPIDVVL